MTINSMILQNALNDLRVAIKVIIYISFLLILFLYLPAGAEEKKGPPTLSADRQALPSMDEETRMYIQSLEKRVSDLESLVIKLMEEKKGAGIREEKVETTPEKPQAEAGEWDIPVTETTTGRDEDARRRITELETWKRKLDAKITTEEEEAAKRVKFELSGRYKVRLNIRDNLNLNNPYQFWEYDNRVFFDQRVALRLDASYGPVTSVLVLDKGNFVFDWKEGSEGTLERWDGFFTVNSALIRELYLQYTGRFVFKAGRHIIILGNRGGVALEGPVDSLKVTLPFGKTPIGLLSMDLAYIAVSGGSWGYSGFLMTGPPAGDRSAVFGLSNKLDGLLLSLDIKPKRGLKIQPYLLKVLDRGRYGDPDLNLDKDFNTATLPRDGEFEPFWIGAAISGREGRFSYDADIIYLTGSYTERRDINAHALMLRGDYKIGHAGILKDLSFGLEAGRGSGNKAEERAEGEGTTEDMKDFNALWMCKERRKFGNIFSEDIRAGYFLWDSNLSNVTFVRAVTSFEPIRDIKTTLSLTKLWTTESVFKGHGPVGNWSTGTYMTTEKTRDIGWEIDLNFDFPIIDRLNGFIEAGYFKPGDVYLRPDGKKADPASEIVIGAEFVF